MCLIRVITKEHLDFMGIIVHRHRTRDQNPSLNSPNPRPQHNPSDADALWALQVVRSVRLSMVETSSH